MYFSHLQINTPLPAMYRDVVNKIAGVICESCSCSLVQQIKVLKGQFIEALCYCRCMTIIMHNYDSIDTSFKFGQL